MDAQDSREVAAQGELRDLADKVLQAARHADLCVARYNLRLAELHAELAVPLGYRLDPALGVVKDGAR